MNANRNSNQAINISPTTLIIDQENIVQQHFRLVLPGFFSVFLSLFFLRFFSLFLFYRINCIRAKKNSTMHNCYEKEEQEEEEKE